MTEAWPDGWSGRERVRAGARPLSEVVHSPTGGGALDGDGVEEFLDEWAETLGGEDNLRERLALDDLAVEDVRERLAAPATGDRQPAPDWLERVERVAARASDLEPGAYDDLVDAHPEWPFVHATAPLVRAASQAVEFPAAFSAAAVRDLEDWLLSRLTGLFRHPLFIRFKRFLGRRDHEPSADSTAAYEAFVEGARDGGFRGTFETYPVLARYVGTVLGQWADAVRELADRLAADRDALARRFGDGEPLGQVTAVETLSDDHHGEGRLVLGVTFESGTTVVYKPRPVGPAAAFGRIQRWTNGATDLPDLYAPAVVERPGYGWMEHVAVEPCESVAAVDRYFERLGGLLALAYLLGGRDLHFENLVAHGEQPVLVDLETVLTPGDPPSRHPEPDALAPTFHGTVLETSMLPVVEEGYGGDRTFAGLREPEADRSFEPRPTFTDPNTDAMDLEFTRETALSGSNLPVLDGESRQPDDHLDALEAGFETVARTVARQREPFLAAAEAAFEGRTMRYLYRQTIVYGSHLLRNTYSSHLRSGLRAGLETEELYRPFADGHVSDPAHLDLVVRECAAMARRDVPRFTIGADERTLYHDGEPVSTVASSPLDRARRRVESIDAATIETQLGLLGLPFTVVETTGPASDPATVDGGPVATADSTADLVSHAVETIRETVTDRRGGGLTWPDLTGPALEDAVVFAQPSPDLYDGFAGVGLFLAAVAAVRDDDEARDLAYGLFESVTDEVASGEKFQKFGPGGMMGVGSVVYGLCRAGTLLDDPALVDAARTASAGLDREDVAADEEYGVVDGAAGELLGQLVLHEETGDAAALERATWCGDHLLSNRVEAETGHRVWRGSHFARPLFGFSHGAAGIGYALARLGAATGRDEYLAAASEAFAFETTLFERDGGWVDRRDDVPDGDGSAGGWCHGRPGIGASRLGVRRDVAALDCERGFRRAVERRSTDLSLDDSLCCGTAGRVRFLQEAGETLDDPAVVGDADALLDALRARASEEGWARLKGHTLDVPRLSLFNGVSGVGYAALGVEADPGALPHVTRLE